MGFWDDIKGAVEGTAIGLGTDIGAIGSAIGAAVGGDKINQTVSSVLNPKAPSLLAPPTTPDPQNSGDALQKAEEEEQAKTRGEAANFLTAGGGAGLSSTGRTSRAVLLGS